MIKQYGISSIKDKLSDLDKHIENVKRKGFTILNKVLDETTLNNIRHSLDENYRLQEDDFGLENMIAINERDLLRCPLLYDDLFLKLITNKLVLDIVKSLLGNEVLLHLQNGVINRPAKVHHQSSWHRDLPYQEYTISRPLGISVFYCIDEFNSQTGSTILLPYSHKEEKMPSQDFISENEYQIQARPGDIVIFDCMVYHRAGYNSSSIIRRGINNVFVAPFLKQQINLPKILNGKYSDDELLNSLLGYKYDVPESVLDYRKNRMLRKNKNNE